jgi:hypothetical protein
MADLDAATAGMSKSPTSHTFIVRLVRSTSAGRVRGNVQHVSSRRARSFASSERLLSFIQQQLQDVSGNAHADWA